MLVINRQFKLLKVVLAVDGGHQHRDKNAAV